MKKRPSILLEILLAIALLSAALPALVKKPTQLYLSQMKSLKEVEEQRLADLAFAEIKLHLHNHQIPWKKLPTKQIKQKIYPLPPTHMNIPHCTSGPIQRKATFKLKREKIDTAGNLIRLLEIEIQFDPSPNKYVYQTIVTKLSA